MSGHARRHAPRTDRAAAAHLYEWQQQGACQGADTNLFFTESDRGYTRINRENAAKALCATCPVAQECLEYALTHQEPYGIWGGLTPVERGHTRNGTYSQNQATTAS